MPAVPMFSVATAGMPAVKDMSGEWLAFMGINQQRDAVQLFENLQSFGRAPADEAWVYRCMTIKARAAQSVPLMVWVKTPNENGGYDRIEAALTNNQAAKDLAFLLENVNPGAVPPNAGSDLKAFTQAAIDVWGLNYTVMVRGSRGGPPQELYWLRAPDMTAQFDSRTITGYTYAPHWNPNNTSQSEYRAKDVIALRRINLQDPSQGLSPLSAVRYNVSVLQQSATQTASLLNNNSIPPGYWAAQKDAEIGNQDIGGIRRVLRLLRGPQNRGKVPVLTAPIEWKAIALNSQDADSIANQKVSRMAVCAAFGVPLVVAGDDERTTVYHNMRDAERILWRMSVIPDLDWIADSYNNWLVPEFDPLRETIEVAFDYSGIEALQDPESTRKTTALNELKLGARTVNEYRKDFAIGGGTPVDWGSGFPEFPAAAAGPDVAPAAPENDGDVQHSDGTGDNGSGATREFEVLLREGLRRRYSAKQLLEGVPAEGFAGLKAAKDQPEAVREVAPQLNFTFSPTLPPSEPQPVNVVVNVPEQNVTVNVPEQPTPNVTMAAPNVTVNVPEQPAPVVNVMVPEDAAKRLIVERDLMGRISEVREVTD